MNEKQNAVYPVNELLAYAYYNLDESWQHYAKWTKTVTKDQILYDPF